MGDFHDRGSRRTLSAFLVMPHLVYPDLASNERILHVLRKHPFVFLATAIRGVATMLLLPIVFLIAVPSLQGEDLSPVMQVSIPLVLSLAELYLWLFLFIHWLEYYLDIWIITDRRLINIDQRRLFSRVVSEVPLEKIQDCSSEVVGIVRTLFHFGDIDVQTAAEEKKFTFKNIPNPERHRGEILELLGRGKS